LALTPVSVDPAFRRRLTDKTPAMQGAILECVRRLRENWRHPSLRTKKMQGQPGVFEARVDRANRVTFHWDGETIVLRNHCNHDVLRRNP
jgi:mRNA interferase RelE/StbE